MSGLLQWGLLGLSTVTILVSIVVTNLPNYIFVSVARVKNIHETCFLTTDKDSPLYALGFKLHQPVYSATIETQLKIDFRSRIKIKRQNNQSSSCNNKKKKNHNENAEKKIYTFKSADSKFGKEFIAAVKRMVSNNTTAEPIFIAFDCEGFKLSRLGSIEIISIAISEKKIFIIDVGEEPDSEVLKTVKELFESKNIVKIIHDCRMDCDALFHIHGIKLERVHDTITFHQVITGKNKNLNDVLMYNGIEQNNFRDNDIYKTNPGFWKTRPLTREMINWASSDVDKLFRVASSQLERMSETDKNDAVKKSDKNTSYARYKVESGLRVKNPGLFIGRRGANIRKLEDSTGTLITDGKAGAKGNWTVYYRNNDALRLVKRSMLEN